MTVRHRLAFTFVLLGIMLAVPSFFAAQRLGDLRELATRERARHAVSTLALGRIEAGIAEFDAYLTSYVATADSLARDSVVATLRRLRIELTRIDVMSVGDAHYGFDPELTRLEERTALVDSLVHTGQLDAATDVFIALQRNVGTARSSLKMLDDAIAAKAAADYRRAERISSSSRATTLLSVVGALVLGALLSLWTTGALWKPLERLRRALSQVAEGNYAAPDDLPYDQKGELGDLSISFREMTRRLDELDRLKAEFVGIAGHELKTPINVIRGYTELIEEELAGELTNHQREILHRIAEQTQAMTRMVSHLMDISRLETGDFPMEPERVMLADLLTGLQNSVEILATERGVELGVEIMPDAPEEIVVDVDLIRGEVLGNLVSNALRFTPDGGTIRIRAWGDEGGVIIEVADSGPGVPPEHRPHIFEKYYQAERSRALGSGLGLAIARELVEAHGGWIRLSSERRGGLGGAVFRVWLPVGEAVRTAD